MQALLRLVLLGLGLGLLPLAQALAPNPRQARALRELAAPLHVSRAAGQAAVRRPLLVRVARRALACPPAALMR